MLPLPHLIRRRNERGFSLVEVIIAMTVLAIVVSGAAVAVVSSDTVEVRSKAVADTHAMAEQAVERLRQDLSARSGCDAGGWIARARSAKQSPTNAQVDFQSCRVDYNDMRDAKGRRYAVRLYVEPKDLAADGYGAKDADGDLRDSYDVETLVSMQADSTAGRESLQPVRVGATVDWDTGSTDDATIRFIACAIDRPDRSLIGGNCASGSTQSRQPVNVSLSLTKVNDATGGTSGAGTITSGGAPGAVAPGTYRLTAPTSSGAFKLLKLDPANLRVYGSQNYTVYATYMRADLRTRVCTQISGGNVWDTNPEDDGYEILATNMHWRRAKQAGFRSIRLNMNGDGNPARGFQGGNGANRSWNCAHVLLDPIQADPSCPASPSGPTALCPSLYKGIYDIEVEQVERFSDPRYAPTGRWGRFKLQVTEAKMNCQLRNWDQTIGGTNLIGRGRDSQLERPDSAQKNKASFYARMPITANTGTQTLCLRFHSKPFERTRCYDTATAGVYNRDKFNQPIGGCFYVGTTCKLPAGTVDNDSNCWNGADVCASCGSGGLQGTTGPVQASRRAGGVSGGPNDPTVACNTGSSYVWPGSRRTAVGPSTDLPMGTILSTNWVGGSSSYYSSFNGRASATAGHSYGVHPDRFTYNLPDNPPYFCTGSYFSLASGLFAGNGGPYRYYECLEVQIPGRPQRVRGRVYDVSGSGSTFYLTVGAAIQMAPDSARIQNHWNPWGNGSTGFTDVTAGGNWPNMNISRVTGDPNCGAPVIHVDPIIEEVWEKVIDETGTRPLPPPPYKTDLGRDRVGV